MRYCIVVDSQIVNTIIVDEGSDWQPPIGIMLPEDDARAQYEYAPAPEPPAPSLSELQQQLEALQAAIAAMPG